MIDWVARAKARFQASTGDSTDETDGTRVLSVPSAGSEGPLTKAPTSFVGSVGTGAAVRESDAVMRADTSPDGLLMLVGRLSTAGLLVPGDEDLIAEMHVLDPDGTAWLLRDMLLRARGADGRH